MTKRLQKHLNLLEKEQEQKQKLEQELKKLKISLEKELALNQALNDWGLAHHERRVIQDR